METAKTTLGVAVFMVIAVAVIAVVQEFVWKSRRKKESGSWDGSGYGTL